MKEIDKSNVIREKLVRARKRPLAAYMDLTVGEAGFGYFILYESITSILGPMPGALGFLLRRLFYPRLLKSCGRGLILGRNVVLRHPRRVVLGDHVTIDDNCVIDGRGAGSEGIVLEDHVIINRNCMILAKAGPIIVGSRTSLGSNSSIVSMDRVELGAAVLTAGGCCLSAGSYRFDDAETAIMDQPVYAKGPIVIGAKSWLGTGVIVLDGVTVGEGAVIGAASLVNKAIPDGGIAFGIPAKVQRIRNAAPFVEEAVAAQAPQAKGD